MSKLFDSSDSEDNTLNTNKDYASNYNKWRQKEELNKLKTKYVIGDNVDDDNSSSSSDDDTPEFDEEIDREFLETLSSLKSKDPKVYDPNIKFFTKPIERAKSRIKHKESPITVRDYERKLIFNTIDDEDTSEHLRPRSPTYVEEQKHLKEAFNVTVDDSEDFIVKRQNDKKEKDENDYSQWLLGQQDTVLDEDVVTSLKPLKDYWNDPKLGDGEKFLRDYILKKRFLENENEDYIPTYDEVVHDSDRDLSEDEHQLEKQEEFEHKFNFRFEEPDEEFIKRYPRTIEQSVRKVDDRRALKRSEIKQRKLKEKEEKMQEIKQLQQLKLKEIEERLLTLKEVAGQADIQFDTEDIDGDFDPEAHDKKMRALFDDKFYGGAEEEQKPEFPDVDEDLNIENWDRYNKEEGGTLNQEFYEPHCEDDDFNMDCDYDPSLVKNDIIESTSSRKKRRRSKFAQVLSQAKPVFDPSNKTFEKYLDEYYKLDCEDIVGDVKCRFKYRQVEKNSFGLDINEILRANDRELNRWCSIKKVIQYRPDNQEKYDVIAYRKKGQNESMKQRLLPSLYTEQSQETNQISDKSSLANVNQNHANEAIFDTDNAKKSKNAKRRKKSLEKNNHLQQKSELSVAITHGSYNPDKGGEIEVTIGNDIEHTRQSRKRKIPHESNDVVQNFDSNVTDGSKRRNKKRKTKKHGVTQEESQLLIEHGEASNGSRANSERNIRHKKDEKVSKKKTNVKNKSNKNENNPFTEISDERLKAYGLNPKKFRNKLKYGPNSENVH